MKADLHVHTCHSPDSKADPKRMVDSAREHGLGCIAITDHNSFAAYAEVRDRTDVIVIPGEEVSSTEGHIIALGIDREIPAGLSIIETIDAIHEAGGIAIAAHPYRWSSGLGERNVIPEFDGVEALNGRSTSGANRRSYALAKRFGKMITAGSDAHCESRVGDSFVHIPDECRTWQDVLEFLRNERPRSHSINRNVFRTIGYGLKSVTEWAMRGFRKM